MDLLVHAALAALERRALNLKQRCGIGDDHTCPGEGRRARWVIVN